MWRGVTAVSTLGDDLTFIIISAILSFSKLLPENSRIHAESRNSNNIQGFVNILDILESS